MVPARCAHVVNAFSKRRIIMVKVKAAVAVVVLLLATLTLAVAMDDMAARISGAKSAADHNAIATDYERQASEATEKATMHENMAKSYTGALKEKMHLDEHCRSIAKKYRDTAT